MHHISRGFSALLFAPVFGVILYGAGCGAADTSEQVVSDEQAVNLDTGEDVALSSEALEEDTDEAESALAGRQTCYSKRNCSGKVLSHRDRHNCKVKSRGKSWRDSGGRCFGL